VVDAQAAVVLGAVLGLCLGGCGASIEQQARTVAAGYRSERMGLPCDADELIVVQRRGLEHSGQGWGIGDSQPEDVIRWSRDGELYYASCPDIGYFVYLRCAPQQSCEVVAHNFLDVICVETY